MADSDIAIVGMQCRFPGAKNISQFWDNLREGRESIRRFTEQELLDAGVDAEILARPEYVAASPVLDDIDLFDAAFFDYTASEAEVMDPQQRLFLQVAHSALENAGYAARQAPGPVGVYGGCSASTYMLHCVIPNQEHLDPVAFYQAVTLNDKDFMASKVSYKLNLKGPAINVQTACSTSLVAVHLACQGLLSGECDMALAGGAAVSVPQTMGYLFQDGMIFSPDGHCRPFDAKAKGTLGGSGVGVVALKRLEDAQRDGDHVYAVIKGSALNNDGSLKVGYMAPGVVGQSEVILEALAVAEVDARSISYVEAHGTATSLGDPIEIEALTRAYRHDSEDRQYCAIGSVKSNFGHLDAAAGIAGLIKTALALSHQEIPPSLHFTEANPEIDFAQSPFYVNATLSPWKRPADGPRRAGVSAFGIGGTNAHLILEEAPRPSVQASTSENHLLVLSAASEDALEKATGHLLAHLQSHPEQALDNVAYTLQVGRDAHFCRRALVCRDRKEAVSLLEGGQPGKMSTARVPEKQSPDVIFMFPGQGSPYEAMGRELYESLPAFRAQFDRCSELLVPHIKRDLREVLFRSEPSDAPLWQKAELLQPALFALEYSLAQVLLSWGMKPAALIGHSLGEYVAACLAGVFSLEDGLALVAARGRLTSELDTGSMLAVHLPESETRRFLTDALSLAAINSKEICVLSGTDEAVAALAQVLDKEKIGYRRLRTSHAFHSAMVDPMLEKFRMQLEKIPLKAPEIPFISNLTGTWMGADQAQDPAYWVRHLRQTVLFEQGLAELQQPGRLFLEVGPGRVLSGLQQLQGPHGSAQPVATMEKDGEMTHLLSALGRLWCSGISIDWQAFHGSHKHRRVPLPTYPFEEKRYWISPPKVQQATSSPSERKPLRDWVYLPTWKRCVIPVGRKEAGSWLVFAHPSPLREALLQHLRSFGDQVVLVQAGTGYRKEEENLYTIQPDSGTDYARLCVDLAEAGRLPPQILHLWSLPESASGTWEDRLQWQNRLGFESLMHLAGALQPFLGQERKMIAIGRGLHNVLGREPLDAAATGMLAASRIISQGCSGLQCRSIDLPPAGPVAETASALAREVRRETDLPFMALRGGQPWAADYQPIPLERGEGEERLKVGGTYLLIGGLGRLGLRLAEYLAQNYRARLILLSPSADSPPPEKLSVLQRIREAATELELVRGDAADSETLKRVVAAAEKKSGGIAGIFYLAGITGSDSLAPVAESGGKLLARHLRCKVDGARALAAAVRERRVGFCALFSSLATVAGGAGVAAYSAANHVMDALAIEENRGSDVPWLSIGWDGWAEGTEEKGSPLIRAEEGLEVLRRILDHWPSDHVLVSTRDLKTRLEEASPTAEEDDVPAENRTRHQRPDLQTAYQQPQGEMEEAVAAAWQEMLGLDGIGRQDDFFDLGGHSLLAIQVLSRLNDRFQTSLPVHALFEAPTVENLAALLEQEISDSEEEMDTLAQMLDAVEDLSEDELQAILDAEKGA